jgi:SH3-like domain-containing protein
MMPRPLIAVVTIVCILFSVQAAAATMVSVASGKVNMRKGPGTRSQVAWQLGKGFPLLVLSRKGNWFKVRDFENDVGWVFAPLTNRRPHLIVKEKIVNIRSGPGEKYKIIGKARYGTVFRTVKRGKGWVKVKHEDGLTGWVSRKLMWGW